MSCVYFKYIYIIIDEQSGEADATCIIIMPKSSRQWNVLDIGLPGRVLPQDQESHGSYLGSWLRHIDDWPLNLWAKEAGPHLLQGTGRTCVLCESAEVQAASSQSELLIPGCSTTMNCWKALMMQKSHTPRCQANRLSSHLPLSVTILWVCLLMFVDCCLALLFTIVGFQDTSSKFELFDVLDIDLSGKLPFQAKSGSDADIWTAQWLELPCASIQQLKKTEVFKLSLVYVDIFERQITAEGCWLFSQRGSVKPWKVSWSAAGPFRKQLLDLKLITVDWLVALRCLADFIWFYIFGCCIEWQTTT